MEITGILDLLAWSDPKKYNKWDGWDFKAWEVLDRAGHWTVELINKDATVIEFVIQVQVKEEPACGGQHYDFMPGEFCPECSYEAPNDEEEVSEDDRIK